MLRSLILLLAAVAVPAAAGAQEAADSPVPPVERGWIGISFEYRDRCARCPGDEDARPVRIKQVHEGSPAERAGLRPGDLIVRVDGRATTPDRFKRFGRTLRPGQEVRFTVQRDGRRRRVEMVAGQRPSFADAPPLPPHVEVELDSVRASLLRHMDSLRDRLRADRLEGRIQVRTSGDSAYVFEVGPPGPDAAASRLRDRLHSLQEELLQTWREEREVLARAATEERRVEAEERRRIEELRKRARSLERDLQELYRRIAERSARAAARALDDVELREERDGPTEPPEAPRPPDPRAVGRDYVAGARMTPLNPGLSEYFGVERGVLVTDVLENGPAREAGLRPGDVLVSVAGAVPESVEDVRRRLVRADRWPVALEVMRKGERLELRLPR